MLDRVAFWIYIMIKHRNSVNYNQIKRAKVQKMKREELEKKIGEFEKYLIMEEYSSRTVQKYVADVKQCLKFKYEGEELDYTFFLAFKKYLQCDYQPASVNSKICSVNKFLKWNGFCELAMKTIRIQKKTSLENMVTREEYMQLLEEAKVTGKYRDYLILRTITMTGIRVGELRYFTVEAIQKKSIVIVNKGKVRTIYLSEELYKLLQEYCINQNKESGFIFEGQKNDRPLSTVAVWKIIKRISKKTKINEKKVYPHAFRHLFAKMYMKMIGNIAELADMLGHSNIEITRIYTLTTADEKRANVERLGL